MEKSIAVLAHPIYKIFETVKECLPNYKVHQIYHKGFGNSTAIPVDNISSDEYDALLKEVEQFDILIVDHYDILPIINDIKSVKWMQGIWSGVDVLTPYFNKDNLPKFQYTRFGGKMKQHLSEYVIAHIINTERKTRFLYEQQEKSIWGQTKILENSPPYRLLSQLSVSILGAGDIGKEIAKHCKGFGMTVYGMVSYQRENESENIDELFTPSSLANYLEKSDYVVNTLPKTLHTTGILSNSILKHCAKRQSVFINVGRGNILTEADVIEAIENKWIQSAVLDVFEKEPLMSDSKLWSLPNVTITPHVAGCFLARELVEVFIQNLKLYEEGKPLNYLVDWVKGY
ncbi:glyoxylate/hydroxypyruvate reductase A isoform X1 [Hydra vulgaris]|uniref:glyoxylate/hydroxypyruvate reductase A isoform X1 n=1 Tax=Hydra vulgaris TaxID=6087 RepID=UPI0032EA718F